VLDGFTIYRLLLLVSIALKVNYIKFHTDEQFYNMNLQAVTQVVQALNYKPEGRRFDSSMVSLEFLN
jgi:hypothetical protein